MEGVPYDVLRTILLWLPRPDIFRVSRVSYELNQSVASAINALTPLGNSWWLAKLTRDYDFKSVSRLHNTHMAANEKYVALMPNLLDRIRYAVAARSQELLKYLATKIRIALSIEWNTKKSDVIISVEDLASIMDLVPDAKMVQRMAIRDIPLKQLMDIGRTDLASRLLTLGLGDCALKQEANWLALEYQEHHASEILEMYRRVVTHPNFRVADHSYEALGQAVRSGSAEVVRILLSTMKLVKGKRIGVDSSKGYPVRLAMEAGNAAVLRELIEAGADPSSDVGDDPFREAMSQGQVDLATILSSSSRFERTGVYDSVLLRSSREMKELITQLQREDKVFVTQY